MHSRQQATIQDNRNRATGFTDADWGALEKRLSDTRDLLKDILTHLRKVLDNLKTAGSYQTTGRARRAAPGAKDFSAQYRRPQAGPAAGAGKTTGAAGSRFQSSASSTTASSSASGQTGRQTQAGQTAGAGQFRAGQASQSSTWSQRTSATGQAGTSQARPEHAHQAHQAKAGQQQAGQSRAEKPGAAQGASSTAGQGAQARSAGTSQTGGQTGGQAGQGAAGGQQRQAGSGFSWSWRSKESTGQAGATSGSAQGASSRAGGASAHSSRDDRAGRSGAWNERGANTGGASGQAGSATGGAGGGQRARQDSHQQSSHQRAHQERHEERRRTAGGGSSYQDYSKRNNKSPLGHGRMTLTQACALLCLTYPCTADDVKTAYRKQARRHHPDLGGDEEMMKSINQAYELALSWCSPLRGKTSATWAA